jgi:hypothetical protein
MDHGMNFSGAWKAPVTFEKDIKRVTVTHGFPNFPKCASDWYMDRLHLLDCKKLCI